MQYLLTRDQERPGAIGYSFANVNHYRNNHNYLADHDAETQLYAQTMALIEYLDTRPIRTCSLSEEYVSLMDDLYVRGFIERGDVQTVIEWSNLMMESPPSSCWTIANTSLSSLTASVPKEKTRGVVAVLHINHGHIESIPLWMALHSHEFLSVQIYVPKSTKRSSVCGLSIHCISDDFSGGLAYESMVHAIDSVTQEQNEIVGFLFVHDDIIWRPGLVFSENRALLSGAEQFHPESEWAKAVGEKGVPALDRFRAKYKQVQAFSAQSDFFYVPRNYATQFAIMGRQMREMEVFLEIAVPTMMHSEIMSGGVSQLKLYTEWSDNRNNVAYTLKKFCSHEDIQYDLAHPVKLSTIQGILGHTLC